MVGNKNLQDIINFLGQTTYDYEKLSYRYHNLDAAVNYSQNAEAVMKKNIELIYAKYKHIEKWTIRGLLFGLVFKQLSLINTKKELVKFLDSRLTVSKFQSNNMIKSTVFEWKFDYSKFNLIKDKELFENSSKSADSDKDILMDDNDGLPSYDEL